jgi:selenocysteine lyase/cysteine desulfurase
MTRASGLAAVPGAGAGNPLARYRREFPILRNRIYLNTCSLGALGDRTRSRVAAFLDQWQARGAPAWYDTWWDALAELRAGYGRLIGAPPSAIALAPSLSAALTAVAGALDYARRPRVVVGALDFPTIAYQWLARRRDGIDVVLVESPDGITIPPAAFAAAVDERTAVVATSHVYFATGAIQDIRAVAEVAHACGALCLVDAYQSAGQVPVDVAAAGVDVLLGGGLKWLLGGPGIAFAYVRPDLIAALEPRTAGWFGHVDQFAFDPARIEWHADARRFEQGTPALAAVHAQLGGLEYIEEIGVGRIREVTARLVEDLVRRARDAGFAPRVAAEPGTRSAIVPLPLPDPAGVVRALAADGIVVDARPGHVRLSPFFYNVAEDHVQAIDRLAALHAH